MKESNSDEHTNILHMCGMLNRGDNRIKYLKNNKKSDPGILIKCIKKTRNTFFVDGQYENPYAFIICH